MLIITCENDYKVVLMEGNTFLTHVLLQNKIGSSQSLLAGNNSVFGKINRYIHQLIDTNLKAGKIENIILSVIICVTQHSKTLAKSNNLMMPTSYSSTPPPHPPHHPPKKNGITLTQSTPSNSNSLSYTKIIQHLVFNSRCDFQVKQTFLDVLMNQIMNYL